MRAGIADQIHMKCLSSIASQANARRFLRDVKTPVGFLCPRSRMVRIGSPPVARTIFTSLGRKLPVVLLFSVSFDIAASCRSAMDMAPPFGLRARAGPSKAEG
ncbi:hypothetical protein [Bradyrhizobium sp. WSM2793]|uniref:hypothetical protein n=1 Tax=Bradyrhizobium sp. WSM2793 TaxID=1038866 RepID=UPI00037EA005|nr:hypothetical protein [Bradyrhizobium sp. WSM2793]